MAVKKSPCVACGDRFAGCHSNCKQYIEWKDARDKKQQEINENRAHDKISVIAQNKAWWERNRMEKTRLKNK